MLAAGAVCPGHRVKPMEIFSNVRRIAASGSWASLKTGACSAQLARISSRLAQHWSSRITTAGSANALRSCHLYAPGLVLPGHGRALVLDSTNAAWLGYNVTESRRNQHLTVDYGSVVFGWPEWAGTMKTERARPMGRLIEAGS